jgi:UDP-glucose 4-epimerase
LRILLTGSSGWLGRYLAPRLRQDGHHVIGLDVAPAKDTDVVGSVANRSVVDRAFAGGAIDAVVHAGALHKPDIARYPAQAFIDVNVTGTLNLLEAAVAAGTHRFVFTSSTSLMISAAIRAATANEAAWLTEDAAPLEPRNIYGVTKLAAEQLCRLYHQQHGLSVVVLRTGRFFPEEDDDLRGDGRNLKANEFLHRRLTVEDAAEAHVVALAKAPKLGFETFIVSASTPFTPADRVELMHDASAVITRYFPAAAALYAQRGWQLPTRIDRVYDAGKADRLLGFRCRTDFTAILDALARGAELPFGHDPDYVSPKELNAR